MTAEQQTEARNELALVANTLAEYDAIEAGLAELRTKYADVVFDVSTTKGMKDAIAARAECRDPRIATEKARKAGKAPVLALGKQIDERAKYITAELLKLEDPIDGQIFAENERKEAEKQARMEAERQRVIQIRASIQFISGRLALAAGKTSAQIAEYIDGMPGPIGEDSGFQEFSVEAESVRVDMLARLQEMHAAALSHEAEQARIAAERAELAVLREQQAERERQQQAELDAQRAEQKRLDDAAKAQRDEEERQARAKRAEEDRIAREQREAEERAAKAERDEADRVAREARQAEEKRLADQRAELKRQQDAIDAESARKAKAEADRKATAEAKAAAKRKAARPADSEIIGVLAMHYHVHESKVIEWLLDVDLDAASSALADEFKQKEAA